MCWRGRRPCLVWRGGWCNGKNCPRTARTLGREKPARVRSPEGEALPKSLTGVRAGQSGAEGRFWSPRPSLVLARNPILWASRKESSQGLGPNATSARAAPGEPAGLQRGKQDPARPTLPCLSPDPSALTPPHDALQPPLRHRRRHLPQAVEPQPPPPTHNLL